jgi:hypothetical protein
MKHKSIGCDILSLSDFAKTRVLEAWSKSTPAVSPVLRQNVIRVENGLIPRCNDLDMTRELNQKASPIG